MVASIFRLGHSIAFMEACDGCSMKCTCKKTECPLISHVVASCISASEAGVLPCAAMGLWTDEMNVVTKRVAAAVKLLVSTGVQLLLH